MCCSSQWCAKSQWFTWASDKSPIQTADGSSWWLIRQKSFWSRWWGDMDLKKKKTFRHLDNPNMNKHSLSLVRSVLCCIFCCLSLRSIYSMSFCPILSVHLSRFSIFFHTMLLYRALPLYCSIAPYISHIFLSLLFRVDISCWGCLLRDMKTAYIRISNGII